jgi:dTDP-4-dehydrorhamnose 3,5-epimerase
VIFRQTELKGSYLIEVEPIQDDRGFFARSFCRKEFETHGLATEFVQCNISYNKKKGTLRGMHLQTSPHEEAKIVSCIRGALYDVIVDLRKMSPTYCKWLSFELKAEENTMLYVPKGFAHGFQTLVDDTSVYYHMSELHYPECAKGYRWNDPAFGIEWPYDEMVISDKDHSYPLLSKDIL